ncbi:MULTISPECIES: hypothetical protein [Streptomyces]|uniref:Uncharacterized protein n=1 Tax=Streptomyces venezuelae (strain ATCC 10712 / CBS 650.69 / DSM 40230 / JCM 4526 / NBRC 13096 / PD 04745) TaxID=953739 RepID=F2RKZ9_STRVP|nr:hypothetical protein [Streptomyces venezuelae]APE21368.1 hypothetical protein vnz_10275 [Streptomyces venezuelae]QER98757.1 hypothetical protein DEJ43_10405 [Streptomyces venezuelae ATCC 10712]CCA55388.1 hypothetical protein SVEN_2102 [Streptomyces venezuelae ATCC 10712]
MTQPSPADELRAAAEKLRDYTSTTSPAPWHVNQWDNVETAGREEMAEVWPLQANPSANATYIALMHPGVGTALADLLDDQADGDDEGVINPWALAVARALNGEAQ